MKLIVQANYSITGEDCEVEVLAQNTKDLLFFVEYPTGYTEWLPVTAFAEV